jgi:hypothetical protein
MHDILISNHQILLFLLLLVVQYKVVEEYLV